MEHQAFKALKDKVCVITGGGGVLGTSMAHGLASAGVITVILDINEEAAKKLASEISSDMGVKSYGYKTNVLDRASLEEVRKQILDEVGEIDMLINGAGGNSPKATIPKITNIFQNSVTKRRNQFGGKKCQNTKQSTHIRIVTV